VQLQPGKNVMDTATWYYKLGKKLKRAPAMLKPRLERLDKTILLIKESLEKLKSISDATEIRQLLTRAGADKSQSLPGTKPVEGESTPDYRVLRSSLGEKILVGKSAKGNDVLTFKVARSYDFWFHAQQAPGSHVVLVVVDKNQAPSRRSVSEAAQAAAYYSDLRKSKNVPVMYTEKRHVRKAKDGAPGKVVVQQFKSIFVRPLLPETKSDSSA
jgi:predicted ribosome quality control (RQC) complex YloA/Tae2 family protein